MSEPLQFDNAVYEAPAAAACQVCAGELRDAYFEANGKRVCPRCRDAMIAPPEGTPLGRFVDALLWGSGAALLGFVLYYGVLKLTGMEIGLISIVVGIGVGLGVRKGARGIGGPGYQALAIVLTYLSITATYFVVLMQEVLKIRSDLPAEAYWLAVELALQGPFLGGTENILGILIVGFGLYEAWKINKPVKITVTGPFEIKAAAPDAAPVETEAPSPEEAPVESKGSASDAG